MNYKGLGIAVITPFDDQLNVDVQSLKNIIRHLVDHGADYLVMLGTTGESVTLDPDEKRLIIDTALEENNGKLPVVVGIGGNNTQQLTTSINTFDFTGIDSILSVSPYYNKPSQEGIYRHYKAIAESCPVPVILYNVPGRTGSNIQAETTLRLASDFNNIKAVKEASGNPEQIMEIVQNKPEGFQVISGDDALTLPLLSIGVEGVISVIGNAYPREFSDMIQAYRAGENQKAMKLHYQLFELIQLAFSEGSPAGIKAILNQMGLCATHVRQPLYPMSKAGIKKAKELIKP